MFGRNKPKDPLKDATIIVLKPDDVFIVQLPGQLTQERAAEIKARLINAQILKDRKLVLLADGATLRVVREVAATVDPGDLPATRPYVSDVTR